MSSKYFDKQISYIKWKYSAGLKEVADITSGVSDYAARTPVSAQEVLSRDNSFYLLTFGSMEKGQKTLFVERLVSCLYGL